MWTNGTNIRFPYFKHFYQIPLRKLLPLIPYPIHTLCCQSLLIRLTVDSTQKNLFLENPIYFAGKRLLPHQWSFLQQVYNLAISHVHGNTPHWHPTEDRKHLKAKFHPSTSHQSPSYDARNFSDTHYGPAACYWLHVCTFTKTPSERFHGFTRTAIFPPRSNNRLFGKEFGIRPRSMLLIITIPKPGHNT